MKKKITIELPKDPGLEARRKARAAAGSPKPARVITPKQLKPPKHRKPAAETEE